MKIKTTCFAIFLAIGCLTSNSQTIVRHGLLLNVGIGDEDSKINKTGASWYELGYKAGFSVGYRLQIKKPTLHSFHYDMDVNIGAKLLKPSTYSSVGSGTVGCTPDYFSSINGTANYSFIDNLSIGLGVEPTYYFSRTIPGGIFYNGSFEDSDTNKDFDRIEDFGTNKDFVRKNKFDIPVVAKISYNFKKFEVGIYGKYGMVNVLETAHFKYGKYRDVQLFVFIPF